MKDATGQTYSPFDAARIVEGYSEPEKDVLSHYGASMWKDLYPGADSFAPRPWGAAWQISLTDDTEAGNIQQAVDDIAESGIPQIVLGKPADFDAAWDRLLKRLDEAGADKLEQTFNEKLQERLRMWGNG